MRDDYLETYFQGRLESLDISEHVWEEYEGLLTEGGLEELYEAAWEDLHEYEKTLSAPLPTFYATLKKLGLYDDED